MNNVRDATNVTTHGNQDVDDLALLVDCPVHVPPHAGDVHGRLTDEPSGADRVAPWSRRVDQDRCEALHPPIQHDVIDLDTVFSDEFFEAPLRQSVSQIPAHGHQNHLGRKPEPCEY